MLSTLSPQTAGLLIGNQSGGMFMRQKDGARKSQSVAQVPTPAQSPSSQIHGRSNSCPPENLMLQASTPTFISFIRLVDFSRPKLEALQPDLPVLNQEDYLFLYTELSFEDSTSYMSVITEYVRVLDYGDRVLVDFHIMYFSLNHPDACLWEGVTPHHLTLAWAALLRASERLKEIEAACPDRFSIKFYDIQQNRLAKYHDDHPIIVFLEEYLRTSYNTLLGLPIDTILLPFIESPLLRLHYPSPWRVPTDIAIRTRFKSLIPPTPLAALVQICQEASPDGSPSAFGRASLSESAPPSPS